MSAPLHAVNRRALLLAGGAALVLAGCAGGGQQIQIYVLRPDLAKNPPGVPVNWSLSVATPYAAAGLNIDRIGLTRSAETLDYFADSAWTDRLPVLVQSALVEAFETSGRITQVSRDTSGLKSDYVLETELRDFTAHYETTNSQPPNIVVNINAKLVALPERTIVGSLEFAADGEGDREQRSRRGKRLQRGADQIAEADRRLGAVRPRRQR